MRTSVLSHRQKTNRSRETATIGPRSYREAKCEFERNYLIELLVWARGNVKKAADRANRDRKGLYILMAKHGLNPLLFREKD